MNTIAAGNEVMKILEAVKDNEVIESFFQYADGEGFPVFDVFLEDGYFQITVSDADLDD